jgi:two-component system chemotaxis sensor kinase CheA
MDINQFKQKFIDEAESLLVKLGNIIVDLEKDPDNKQLIDETFRIMHTIKGASGMYGFEKIVELTHEMESLYDMIRNETLHISPSIIELTFSTIDLINAMLYDEFLQIDKNKQLYDSSLSNLSKVKDRAGIITKAEVKSTKSEDCANEEKTWCIAFYPSDELIRRCVNIFYTLQDLFELGEYRIMEEQTSLVTGEPFWIIFLMTNQPYAEIENALVFVLDYCKIVKVADYNIFTTSPKEKTRSIETFLTEPEIALVPEKAEVSIDEKQDITTIPEHEIKTDSCSKISKSKISRINVDASKLDSLMYLVSELVTTKSELMVALQKQNQTKALEAAEKIEKLSKLFSDNALSIRLVSLQELLNKFKRLVRDLSKQLNKNIDFVVKGEDTELDKNIIDAIGEPIMHLIRNNIDHGIELPEQRILSGKPEMGTITFEAYKSGNSVFINISDDGKGIDSDFIYNKAIEKGFIPKGTKLTEKEILELIFLPGFSTAQSLSNISGRGVGMDIVLKKIQEIRGEISIVTRKGEGTLFAIKLQQTISIIDTLLVTIGNTTFAIPVEDIEACGLELHDAIAQQQNRLIVFNNELIPYVNLRKKLTYSLYLPTNEKLVIIKKQTKHYAMIVDNIIGEFQAVIKPMGDQFKHIEFISGASLMGDGSIAFLLDTDKLWNELTI